MRRNNKDAQMQARSDLQPGPRAFAKPVTRYSVVRARQSNSMRGEGPRGAELSDGCGRPNPQPKESAAPRANHPSVVQAHTPENWFGWFPSCREIQKRADGAGTTAPPRNQSSQCVPAPMRSKDSPGPS